MAFGLLPGKTARECGSIAVLAMISAIVSHRSSRRSPGYARAPASCEAVACDDNGVASFDLVRHHRANDSVFLYAFDLIELNGDDLRRDPLEVRKATLASILAKARPGMRFNEHIEGDGPTVFAHACKLGLEGIVSKRKDSAYRSGRSPDWLKMKNANGRAVKREEEEEWGKKKR
jgi:ATP-dependent DNA ligase